ncbi:MAG: hypothetical protein WBF17_23310, partial [Phycisphaerae bacterium]
HQHKALAPQKPTDERKRIGRKREAVPSHADAPKPGKPGAGHCTLVHLGVESLIFAKVLEEVTWDSAGRDSIIG